MSLAEGFKFEGAVPFWKLLSFRETQNFYGQSKTDSLLVGCCDGQTA